MPIECPECFEETRAISSDKAGLDANQHPTMRRYRVCINENCRLYMIRLATLEVYVPLQEKPYVLPKQKRFPDKPERTEAVPDEPIPGVNA